MVYLTYTPSALRPAAPMPLGIHIRQTTSVHVLQLLYYVLCSQCVYQVRLSFIVSYHSKFIKTKLYGIILYLRTYVAFKSLLL